jgi:multidrug efflux pump subunit AcrA (membrane-fusion protein)
LAYSSDTFSGAVEWISGALDPVSRTAKVRCSIANPQGRLRPEMFGTADISVNPEKKMAIRRSALLLLGEQPVVFVQTGTAPNGQLKFERRPIAVDEMAGGDYVPVKGGVDRGDKVVVKGGVLLLGML